MWSKDLFLITSLLLQATSALPQARPSQTSPAKIPTSYPTVAPSAHKELYCFPTKAGHSDAARACAERLWALELIDFDRQCEGKLHEPAKLALCDNLANTTVASSVWLVVHPARANATGWGRTLKTACHHLTEAAVKVAQGCRILGGGKKTSEGKASSRTDVAGAGFRADFDIGILFHDAETTSQQVEKVLAQLI